MVRFVRDEGIFVVVMGMVFIFGSDGGDCSCVDTELIRMDREGRGVFYEENVYFFLECEEEAFTV